ncbi:hypothetical protein [Nostoc sp.]|uniref:hypothetical protein n=1 Tax=Nostoc sp. TaxID=1180 RepID=UPI002FF5BEDE
MFSCKLPSAGWINLSLVQIQFEDLPSLYPAFYSNPDTRKKQKSAFDFADYLAEIKPDYAILEPTGNHYSRLWASILKKKEIKILWVESTIATAHQDLPIRVVPGCEWQTRD